MIDCKIKELIDSGFIVSGTAPEQEVLYELMETILKTKTAQRLYDLLNVRNKVTLSFYHKKRRGEQESREGGYSPPFNQIFINIHTVRSFEARISILTHELFHALQCRTKTLHRGFNADEGRQVFMLNELEARFKSMEILNELYPDANFVLTDLPHDTKVDCLVYKALHEQAQKALMSAGQKSPEIAQKISRRLARAEMLKSQLFSITPHVAQVLGQNWANEFESINQAWQESYQLHSQKNNDLTSIFSLLKFETKPNLRDIQMMIANRLELPVEVFQNATTSPQVKQQNRHQSNALLERVILTSRISGTKKR